MKTFIIAILAVLSSCQYPSCQKDGRQVAVIIGNHPRNFGSSISVTGKLVFGGEAPIFVSKTASAAYWLVDDPPDVLSRLRLNWRPGETTCIEMAGKAVISGNLISRHVFINHRGIKFSKYELGELEAQCRLSAEEQMLLATEV